MEKNIASGYVPHITRREFDELQILINMQEDLAQRGAELKKIENSGKTLISTYEDQNKKNSSP